MLFTDPINWTETHIKSWLTSVQTEYDVPPLHSDAFPTSGPSLCSLSEVDFISLAGPEVGALLFKYLTCLRQPFTGDKFVEPSVPLPTYRPRMKRPSSSSSCSTSSMATSALSPAASLSSSNPMLSGKSNETQYAS